MGNVQTLKVMRKNLANPQQKFFFFLEKISISFFRWLFSVDRRRDIKKNSALMLAQSKTIKLHCQQMECNPSVMLFIPKISPHPQRDGLGLRASAKGNHIDGLGIGINYPCFMDFFGCCERRRHDLSEFTSLGKHCGFVFGRDLVKTAERD